jgi:hypothetical protein
MGTVYYFWHKKMEALRDKQPIKVTARLVSKYVIMLMDCFLKMFIPFSNMSKMLRKRRVADSLSWKSRYLLP